MSTPKLATDTLAAQQRPQRTRRGGNQHRPLQQRSGEAGPA